MFWDEEQLNSLQKLLTSGQEVTLAEVLKDPYCLQELRQGYQPLVEILTKHENLLELVKTALVPELELDKNIEEQYVSSNFAAEVLSVASIDQIVEAIFQDTECLNIITNMLDCPVEKFNSVNAIFFAKIFSTLLSKNFDATLKLIKENNLLNKCRKFFNYGAIADLVSALIRLNNEEKQISSMKEYLVEEQFIAKLIELLDENVDISIQENAAEVFIDMLRNIREVLAVSDEKNDVLHADFLNRENIDTLLDRMLMKENNNHKISREIRSSLLSNGMLMLTALLEHNTTGITPIVLMESSADSDNWTGGLPGEIRPLADQARMWLPDRERLAERLVAKRVEALVSLAIEDLEQEDPSDWWLSTLGLVAELLNTNCFETHTLVYDGFRRANFKKLFTYVEKYPTMHIFHHLLREIVAFVLFSDLGDEVSPLLEYFVKECELFSILKDGVYPVEGASRMTTMSLLSFHVYLADCFTTAARRAPKKALIAEILKASPDWSGDAERTVEQGLQLYWEKNMPDEYKMSSNQSSGRLPTSIDTFDDIDAFSRFECTADIPEIDPIKGPTSILYNFTVNPPASHEALRINLRENDAKEENFEKADEFVPLSEVFNNSLSGWADEKWPGTEKNNEWPGEFSSKAEQADDSDGFWDNCPPISSNSSDFQWPSSSNSSNKIGNPFE